MPRFTHNLLQQLKTSSAPACEECRALRQDLQEQLDRVIVLRREKREAEDTWFKFEIENKTLKQQNRDLTRLVETIEEKNANAYTSADYAELEERFESTSEQLKASQQDCQQYLQQLARIQYELTQTTSDLKNCRNLVEHLKQQQLPIQPPFSASNSSSSSSRTCNNKNSKTQNKSQSHNSQGGSGSGSIDNRSKTNSNSQSNKCLSPSYLANTNSTFDSTNPSASLSTSASISTSVSTSMSVREDRDRSDIFSSTRLYNKAPARLAGLGSSKSASSLPSATTTGDDYSYDSDSTFGRNQSSLPNALKSINSSNGSAGNSSTRMRTKSKSKSKKNQQNKLNRNPNLKANQNEIQPRDRFGQPTPSVSSICISPSSVSSIPNVCVGPPNFVDSNMSLNSTNTAARIMNARNTAAAASKMVTETGATSDAIAGGSSTCTGTGEATTTSPGTSDAGAPVVDASAGGEESESSPSHSLFETTFTGKTKEDTCWKPINASSPLFNGGVGNTNGAVPGGVIVGGGESGTSSEGFSSFVLVKVQSQRKNVRAKHYVARITARAVVNGRNIFKIDYYKRKDMAGYWFQLNAKETNLYEADEDDIEIHLPPPSTFIMDKKIVTFPFNFSKYSLPL